MRDNPSIFHDKTLALKASEKYSELSDSFSLNNVNKKKQRCLEVAEDSVLKIEFVDPVSFDSHRDTEVQRHFPEEETFGE